MQLSHKANCQLLFAFCGAGTLAGENLSSEVTWMMWLSLE
jgi:hypothetical protein